MAKNRLFDPKFRTLPPTHPRIFAVSKKRFSGGFSLSPIERNLNKAVNLCPRWTGKIPIWHHLTKVTFWDIAQQIYRFSNAWHKIFITQFVYYYHFQFQSTKLLESPEIWEKRSSRVWLSADVTMMWIPGVYTARRCSFVHVDQLCVLMTAFCIMCIVGCPWTIWLGCVQRCVRCWVHNCVHCCIHYSWIIVWIWLFD